MTGVVLAPDKFRGSLTAIEVARALAAGIGQVRPDVRCRTVPVADGGEGTLAVAVAAGFSAVPVTVTGPTGEPVHTAFARRGAEAVIEMADGCGLSRLPGGVPAPLRASSAGVGDAIRAALDAGCTRLTVGVGGSASTDGGAGMLQALGARLLDAAGDDLPPGGAALSGLDRIDLSGLYPGLARARLRIACDVTSPLTGPTGAAAVYGPQKGAGPADVARLDLALTRFADRPATVTPADLRDRPGTGAAGGVAFAAAAVLGAELVAGVGSMLALTGFAATLAEADLVVTGEGSLDEQTLQGKAPAGVAAAARAGGVPVIAVCGRTTLSRTHLAAAGFADVYPLSDLEPDRERSIARAADLLELVGRRIALTLAPAPV